MNRTSDKTAGSYDRAVIAAGSRLAVGEAYSADVGEECEKLTQVAAVD
jgi:hypothetical protein